MNKTVLTSALPYANGPLHIGHVLEYIQTDIYSRFLKQQGHDVIYLCADDTHGTPIEINAAQQGKTPEEFVKQWYNKHLDDMRAYSIYHDSFYSTNSAENKYFTELLFMRLKNRGLIYTKDMELTYCDHDKRFLPDRFVKGICPHCGARDQYGDVCEACNSTYQPIDLIEPYCVLCKQAPVRKVSKHYFFKLSKFSSQLKKFITEGRFQPEIKNQVLTWINTGLEDWCVSRDGPYFGFKIPGEKSKYFYVWLDAPVGYLASLANYTKDVTKAEDYWNSSRIIHFIGKDIVYFHLLFWPAVLMGAGFKTPENVIVHGFITINGEKMSKSRGTFITAKEFREIVDPQYLRYYFASNLTNSMTDIDYNYKDLILKVNNELIANIANFVYRTLSFINKNFDSRLSTVKNTDLINKCLELNEQVKSSYDKLDFRKAIQHVLEIGDIGNKYFQANKPWELVKTDKQKTQSILTECANIVKILSHALYPVLPQYAEDINKQLGTDQSYSKLENGIINPAIIILKKLEPVDPPKGFGILDLKIAKVLSVSEHYKAEKLLLINVDLGSEKRQLVAGLRPYYTDPQVLVGKKIIVVTNLEHADLRGETSQGMLLAAESDDAKIVQVLEAPKSKPGQQVYIKGITPSQSIIKFQDFAKINIIVEEGNVLCDGKVLQTDKEKIKSRIKKGKVR